MASSESRPRKTPIKNMYICIYRYIHIYIDKRASKVYNFTGRKSRFNLYAETALGREEKSSKRLAVKIAPEYRRPRNGYGERRKEVERESLFAEQKPADNKAGVSSWLLLL